MMAEAELRSRSRGPVVVEEEVVVVGGTTGGAEGDTGPEGARERVEDERTVGHLGMWPTHQVPRKAVVG